MADVNKQRQMMVAVFSLLATFFWMLWVNQFPWSLSSDDAFNFSQALERYSVIEFRPHFPGYPGFYWMSVIVRDFVFNDVQAIIAVSTLSAAAIPLLLGIIGYQLSGSLWVMMAILFSAFSQPLLSGLALSGLTDAPAIMFFLMALVCFFHPTQRSWPVGFSLGLMLATRPSYLPLALAFLPLLVSYQYRLSALIEAALPIAVIGGICLLFLVSKDGAGYFAEGVRFTRGHFTIWGNTSALERSPWLSWFHQVVSSFGIVTSVVMVISIGSALFLNHRAGKQCAWIALSYAGYIVMAQNPENLRHFLPVFLLSLVIFYPQLYLLNFTEIKRRILIITITTAVVIVGLTQQVAVSHREAPIQQAIASLSSSGSKQQVIGTNYSVNVVRNQLKHFAVYDMYYPSSESQLLTSANQGLRVWRLSATPLNSSNYQLKNSFMARFPTERNLYLYAVNDSFANNENKK
ncbi:MAG: hypothetical protein JKY55_14770 [Aliivibrio sp.]|uniref:hypothetical protein n=1 Tax=Aliivibrio sp. TaxID=1872443 RepID=UPI001A5409FA|nr:hypothetical protein [Aliivibrio sp.]